MAASDSTNRASRGNSGGKKIMFCSYCGTRLDDGARFCKNCGEPVAGNDQSSQWSQQEAPRSENPAERKTVYEGYLHKCPNCGEVLRSFTAVCPTCGHEIRDAQSSSAARELALKLQQIQAKKMPAVQEDKSLLKMLVGKDFKAEEKAEKAQVEFEKQREKEMTSLIINFPVPNTKEDILEFMILIDSHIDVKRGVDDEMTKAWIEKLKQVYKKAKITMSEHPDFAQIESIYEHKMREMKMQKRRFRRKKIIATLLWIIGMGVLLLLSIILESNS